MNDEEILAQWRKRFLYINLSEAKVVQKVDKQFGHLGALQEVHEREAPGKQIANCENGCSARRRPQTRAKAPARSRDAVRADRPLLQVCGVTKQDVEELVALDMDKLREFAAVRGYWTGTDDDEHMEFLAAQNKRTVRANPTPVRQDGAAGGPVSIDGTRLAPRCAPAAPRNR